MELELVNPDKIWDKFTCDSCHRFLSVNPIRVYPNKTIKCGRCSRNDSEGMISSFGFAASQLLFKCVNRFDGCRKLLKNDQVEEHEKNCSSKKYFCPLCPPKSLELPTYLLTAHFEEQHSRNILEQPWIFVDLGESCDVNKLFLYRVDDHLFFVSFKCNVNDSSFFLNASYVGSAEKAHKIMQKYSLFSKDTNLELKTKVKFCDHVGSSSPNGFSVKRAEFQSNDFIILVELDLKVVELFKMQFYDPTKIVGSGELGELQKIFLSPAYLISNPNYSIDVTGTALVITENDSERTISFQCSVCFSKIYLLEISTIEGKSFCTYCLQYYKEKQPNALINKFSIPQELGDNLKFFCKWNCNTLIPYRSYSSIKHDEDFCPLQPQRICPVDNCKFEGKLYDLQNHFQTSHSDAKLCLNSSTTITYGNKPEGIKVKSKHSPGLESPFGSASFGSASFGTSLGSIPLAPVINKYYFFKNNKFVLVTKSNDTNKSIFSIKFGSKEEVDDKLRPAVIVFNTKYVDTFTHNFVLNEGTPGTQSSITINVIVEKLGS